MWSGAFRNDDGNEAVLYENEIKVCLNVDTIMEMNVYVARYRSQWLTEWDCWQADYVAYGKVIMVTDWLNN